MKTASRWLIALGLVFAASGVTIGTPRAEAQEYQVTGPLAGAPAVRKMRVYRDGRFQIQPEFGATLVDEFTRTLFVGAQIGYHFTDWLGIHAFFDYGLPLDTNLTDQVTSRGQRTDYNALSLPDPKNFNKQTGQIKFLTGIQATFIPLRGKLALFQAAFVDTDFYIFGGVAFANVQERKDVGGSLTTGPCNPVTLRAARANDEFPDADDACKATQTQSTTRLALAPTFGVGLSMYFTDYLAMTLEYRAFPFKWNTSGTDEGGLGKNREPDSSGAFPDGRINADDRTSQFNQMFKLGFAFYLPGRAVITK
ncbi:MAG TPA: outer membrane beta-barrel domain-containing protein [Polyangiales bacterium]|nr:outer membrane beta-barrel domain-containing protein [Polyangiales bacterium]